MLFSLNKLRELTSLAKNKISDKEIIDRLTFSGFEVESVSTLAQASQITTGKIISCLPHPDSDHLHLLKVDCGKHGILDIVCGAQNARKGILVIVALDGCYLPSLSKTIKAGQIRGQVSQGMCCSLLELGVKKELLDEKSTSLNGIEELDKSIQIGDDNILSTLKLDDVILDINVLPNRPDCLCYFGMARELCALFEKKVDFKIKKINKKQYNNDNLKVEINTKACSRIDMIEIKNIVCKKQTPDDIKQLLLASSIRSISPIVDLGNYVMLMSGQPINMYDSSANKSGVYNVNDDFNCTFETFDKKQLNIQNGDLVINDGKNILCLAGISTSEKAMIKNKTKNIVIELATFYHANIRHTSLRTGITTASSLLFSKGRNPLEIDEAVSFLIQVLDEFFTSYEISCIKSVNNIEKTDRSFEFSSKKLNKRLGSKYSEDEINRVLKAYNIEKLDNGRLLPPIYRVDLVEQCDIEEEVFRFYPADKILPTLNDSPITLGKLTPEQKKKREIRELLVDSGLDEILSFTLISEDEYNMVNTFNNKDPYIVSNPMTKDHQYVRTSLLPSMIQTLKYNIDHQHNDLALFEISQVDTKDGEKMYLSIGLHGNKHNNSLYKDEPYTFFTLKGLVEKILNKLGISSERYQLQYSKNEKFHPSCSADIYMFNTLVGTFGKLHPSFNSENMFVCEIDLGYLLSQKSSKTKFTTYSQYPTVRRDFSIVLDDNTSFNTIKTKLLKLRDCNIKDIQLFDLFNDKDGKYLGIAIFLNKSDATLTNTEINNAWEKIIKVIKEDLHLSLRGE